MDFFCLAPVGIRAGYAWQRMLRGQPKRLRHALRGKIVLLLTSNRAYALRGVHPGARFSRAARRLHARHGIHIGRNTWYVVRDGRVRGVLKVRRGLIEEVGIADRRLTRNRAADRRFLRSVR